MQSIFSPSIRTLANKIPLCISLYCTVLCSRDLQRNMSQMMANMRNNEQNVNPPEVKSERKKVAENLFSLNLCVSSITFLRLSISSSLVSLGITYLHNSENYHSQNALTVYFRFSLGCNDCNVSSLHKYYLCFTCSLQPVSPPFPVQACTLYNHHN